MASDTATVTSKGQITIPSAIRKALDIREQDRLLFVREGNHLVLIPLRQRPLPSLYGILSPQKELPDPGEMRDVIGKALGQKMLDELP